MPPKGTMGRKIYLPSDLAFGLPYECIGLIWSDRVNSAKSVEMFL
jgi:hypothetical protein